MRAHHQLLLQLRKYPSSTLQLLVRLRRRLLNCNQLVLQHRRTAPRLVKLILQSLHFLQLLSQYRQRFPRSLKLVLQCRHGSPVLHQPRVQLRGRLGFLLMLCLQSCSSRPRVCELGCQRGSQHPRLVHLSAQDQRGLSPVIQVLLWRIASLVLLSELSLQARRLLIYCRQLLLQPRLLFDLIFVVHLYLVCLYLVSDQI